MKTYYVYIVSSPNGVLYIGMTNDLERRVAEHKSHDIPGFSSKYGCDRLVYFETGNDVVPVIEREKQIKRWSREKKVLLVSSMNPIWEDLSEKWFK
ncbi:MAG: GIY-YIG nuclease family protein [Patescibacteria group bacterium]